VHTCVFASIWLHPDYRQEQIILCTINPYINF